jgi:hypothetical protein
MGYMTEISILNDQFNSIRDNPRKFVDDIALYMNYGGEGIGQTTILHTHHADDARVLFSYGNTFTDFTSNGVWTTNNGFRSLSKKELEFKLEMLEMAQSYLNTHRNILTRELEKVSKNEGCL